MRGGVNVNDLFDRYSVEDIELLHEIIQENLETTRQTQMPLV